MHETTFNRRGFLQVAAMTVVGSQIGTVTAAGAQPAADGIRPFHVNVPEARLADLRARIRATNWPERETVTDDSQGVPIAEMQEFARHWAADYDWRTCEARLNALPQFMTEIDGLDVHFVHVRSKHENALPVVVTHGWPGSIIEQLKIIEPLTNPTAHGGTASDAFHVVIPSMPNYGFSGKPTTRWGPDRTARAWTTLMKRLGYTRFVAQGGDVGSLITNVMALQAPPELLGIHTNFAFTVPGEILKAIRSGSPAPSSLSADEKRAYEQVVDFTAKHFAYGAMQATRPQTLYALSDSPVGLAAWLLDHGDGYGQPAAVILSAALGRTIEGHPADGLTRDDVLDNITLYWLTNTGVSAARSYWENGVWGAKSGVATLKAVGVTIPAAVSVFPGELYLPPRSWTERAYPKLIHYNQVAKGGHFAAWEQPQLFSEELRVSLRPLRT
jgi:pimeloyl-ACP methyl ester carboxylesterase